MVLFSRVIFWINGDEICFDDSVDGAFVALLADNTRLTADDLHTYLANSANSDWLCAQIATGYFIVLTD